MWRNGVHKSHETQILGKNRELKRQRAALSFSSRKDPVRSILRHSNRMIRIKVGVAVLARALASAGVIPEPVGWVIVIGAIVTMIFSFFMYLS